MTLISRMQQKRGTAAQWTASNPILADGEIGLEIDTQKIKIGDGETVWNVLSYFGEAVSGGLAETMWCSLTSIANFGPELGSSFEVWGQPFDFSYVVGDDPPTVDPNDVNGALINADGYHLLTIIAKVDDMATTARASLHLLFTNSGGGGDYGSRTVRMLSNGAEPGIFGTLTVPMHLSEGDTFRVSGVDIAGWTVDADLNLEVILSRIGTGLANAGISNL